MAEAKVVKAKWEKKPLGFSIVMDSNANNAYVSSIQNTENITKGVTLASQIVEVNGTNVDGMKHQSILQLIMSTPCPIELTFKPRSFMGVGNTVKGVTFTGGSDRVNGFYEIDKEKVNGRNCWRKTKGVEEDNILCYFWPKDGPGNHSIKKDLWMVARESKLNTDQAYACCESSLTSPLEISDDTCWKVWSQSNGAFEDAKLKIAQKRF